jgi:uncharacterized protein (TIGR03437 family)
LVRKVALDGTISTISASLNYPGGMALDASGSLFFIDDGNFRTRMVSATGTIGTIAGTGVQGFFAVGGPATSAELNGPFGLTLDLQGNMYFADSMNNRTILVYCTGPGAVSPSVATGAAAGGTMLSNTVATYTATVAGQDAPVVFSGLAPFFVALEQVNLTIPAGTPSGPQDLVITRGGASSNVAKIQIQ